MSGTIWTASNILSMIRAVLVIPIVIFLFGTSPHDKWFAVALIVIASLTDLFDGMLARRRNEVTEFGKIVDPIADKITVAAVLFVLAIQGGIPFWFVWMAVVRDAFIILGGIYVRRRVGVVLQSNIIGKWTVAIIATYALFVIMKVPLLSSATSLLLGMSVILLAVSFLLYAKRFFEAIMGKRQST